MIKAESLNASQLELANTQEKTGFLTRQEIILAVVAGIGSAVLGQYLGKTVHHLFPVPIVGSVVVALPRALLLLAIMLRINRFGALTTAGFAEVSMKLAFGGGGFWPMALIVPILANLVGDIAWSFFRQVPIRTIGLTLTGGVLCGIRVLIALVFWALVQKTFPTYPHLSSILVGIIAVNIVLGMIAGLCVAKTCGPHKAAVTNDQSQ